MRDKYPKNKENFKKCQLSTLQIRSKTYCSKINTTTKKVKELTVEVDSLQKEVINQEEMIELIKETPAWKTLRIEEISDKERISINALEEKDKFNE